jgi:hypothetical protein
MGTMGVRDFFHLLGLLSVLTFVGSLIAVPWLIGRLDRDFFVRHRQRVQDRRRRHPLLAAMFFVARNLAGLALLAAGIAMLVLPGQGLLTMLLGLSFMDFPGKHALLERAIACPKLQYALNWLRRKEGREEFVFPDQEGKTG